MTNASLQLYRLPSETSLTLQNSTATESSLSWHCKISFLL